MATLASLEKRLQEIQQEAAEQNKLYVSSKISLYKALVATYLWWREAVLKTSYLEKQFKARNITYRKQLNKPNFNPVIKLVFNMQQHLHNVQISNWGSAMNAIDDEYLRNAHIYKHRDAEAELVDWINDNGGLRGICGKKAEEIEEYGYDYKETGTATAKKKKRSDTEQKQKQQLEVLELKKLAISESKQATKIDIGAVGTGEDDLVLVLAKATGKGNELRVVGTTAQQALVDGAVMSIAEVDYANTPLHLRMLCEAVKLNTIPKALQNYGARNTFYNKTKLEIEQNGKKDKVRENARVVLQRDGTILVSKSSSDASLTTYYIPKTKIAVSEDIWLRGMDRFWLEIELINESEIALYEATDLEQQKNKAIKATQQMTLKNTLSKQKRNIYFYDFSRVDDATMHQPTVDTKGITYDWTVKGKAAYFRRLYEQHFEGWQHRVKHRVHTANNKAVAFDVGKNGVVCEKKWDKGDLCFTQVGARYLTAFSDDADCKGKGRTVFAPTDIIATLQHIATSNVKGDIVMSGNEDVLFVNFNTDIAEVRVYIPSCSTTGKRNAKCFKKFVANG